MTTLRNSRGNPEIKSFNRLILNKINIYVFKFLLKLQDWFSMPLYGEMKTNFCMLINIAQNIGRAIMA